MEPEAPAPAQVASVPSAVRLLIGPGDELEINFYGVPDLNQKARVDTDGTIDLALVGSIPIAGLTAEEARAAIEARYLQGGFLKDPHVTVYVKEYTTQTITVAGEVAKPGTYSFASAHRLLDLLLAAGGVTDRAGRTISITHAGQPDNPVVVRMEDNLLASAKDNLELMPGDTVVVSRAGVVYVIGEVNKAGGYVMEDNGSMTLTEAIAKAAGPTRVASSDVRIIRRTPNGLQNIELPLKKILAANVPDVPLHPEDIVFVPGSKGKMALDRSTGSVLSMITGLAIYRF